MCTDAPYWATLLCAEMSPRQWHCVLLSPSPSPHCRSEPRLQSRADRPYLAQAANPPRRTANCPPPRVNTEMEEDRLKMETGQRWRQRQKACAVSAERDKADCFEAICRPTLTFPRAWSRSSPWVRLTGEKNKSKHEPREQGWTGDERVRRSEMTLHHRAAH